MGFTTFQDSAIRVRVHRDCPRHRLMYQHWSWFRNDGSAIEDSDFDSNSVLDRRHMITDIVAIPKNFPTRTLPDQEASIAASQEAFGWVTRNCEGHPTEDVYLDEWLREESGSEIFESLDDNSSSSCNNSNVKDSSTDVHGSGMSIQGWIAELK